VPIEEVAVEDVAVAEVAVAAVCDPVLEDPQPEARSAVIASANAANCVGNIKSLPGVLV
jgi:hypothetical protein